MYVREEWHPQVYMLNRMGREELQGRVQSGSIKVRRCPTDARFWEFCDTVNGQTKEASEETSWTAGAQGSSDKEAFLKACRTELQDCDLSTDAYALEKELPGPDMEEDLFRQLGVKKAPVVDRYVKEVDAASVVKADEGQDSVKEKVAQLHALGAEIQARLYRAEPQDKKLLQQVAFSMKTVDSMMQGSMKATPMLKKNMMTVAAVFKMAHGKLQ